MARSGSNLGDVVALGPKEFEVRLVNRAVNKPKEKNIEAIEPGPTGYSRKD